MIVAYYAQARNNYPHIRHCASCTRAAVFFFFSLDIFSLSLSLSLSLFFRLLFFQTFQLRTVHIGKLRCRLKCLLLVEKSTTRCMHSSAAPILALVSLNPTNARWAVAGLPFICHLAKTVRQRKISCILSYKSFFWCLIIFRPKIFMKILTSIFLVFFFMKNLYIH